MKKKTVNLLLFIIFSVIIVVIDQYTKIKSLSLGDKHIILIPKLLGVTCVINKGAAYGLFSDMPILLLTFSIIGLLLTLLFMFLNLNSTFFTIISFLSFSGCLGNLICRSLVLLKKREGVIDMLYIPFIQSFPVFNIADFCLSFSFVLYIIYLILSFSKNRIW